VGDSKMMSVINFNGDPSDLSGNTWNYPGFFSEKWRFISPGNIDKALDFRGSPFFDSI